MAYLLKSFKEAVEKCAYVCSAKGEVPEAEFRDAEMHAHACLHIISIPSTDLEENLVIIERYLENLRDGEMKDNEMALLTLACQILRYYRILYDYRPP